MSDHLAPAYLSPKDVLCSVTFVSIIFWLRKQHWGEVAARLSLSAYRAKHLSQKKGTEIYMSVLTHVAISTPVWKDFVKDEEFSRQARSEEPQLLQICTAAVS